MASAGSPYAGLQGPTINTCSHICWLIVVFVSMDLSSSRFDSLLYCDQCRWVNPAAAPFIASWMLTQSLSQSKSSYSQTCTAASHMRYFQWKFCDCFPEQKMFYVWDNTRHHRLFKAALREPQLHSVVFGEGYFFYKDFTLWDFKRNQQGSAEPALFSLSMRASSCPMWISYLIDSHNYD